jgi:hypothetical protein
VFNIWKDSEVGKRSMAGPVTGWPATLLRIEGACLFASSIWAYWRSGASWWLFAGGFFVPDLSMLGYLSNPATGAAVYNTIHSETLPILLLCNGYARRTPRFVSIALIWLAHINSKYQSDAGQSLLWIKLADYFVLSISGQNGGSRTQVQHELSSHTSRLLTEKYFLTTGKIISSDRPRRSHKGR